MAAPALDTKEEAEITTLDDVVDSSLVTIMHQAEALVGAMQGFFHRLDRTLYKEFRTIVGFIEKAKEEITALRPNDLSKERIPSAGAELEAIIRDTEGATHRIMNSAEAILGADTSDVKAYKDFVDNEVMTIFEACSFQDITGQRVSKVVNVLKQVEERMSRLAEQLGVKDAQDGEMSEAEKRSKDLLLNGPALNGPEVGQIDIDALFGGASDEGEFVQSHQANDEKRKAEAKELYTKAAAKSALSTGPGVTVQAGPPQSQDDIDALFD